MKNGDKIQNKSTKKTYTLWYFNKDGVYLFRLYEAALFIDWSIFNMEYIIID